MLLVTILDFVAVLVLAISGVLTGIERKMDVFGLLVMAFVTAYGGGTIRDLIIDRPVFWVHKIEYIYCLLGSVALAIIFRHTFQRLKKAVMLFDTVGLAAYTVLGVTIGVNYTTYTLHPIICITLGVLTGTFGGLLRDILARDIPMILQREVYATVRLLGGIVFFLCRKLGCSMDWCAVLSMAVIIVVRIIVVHYKLQMPQLKLK